MDIPSKYDPKKTENKWYSYWMEQNFFHSEPDEREPYTVVIPPPNVTGVLHMGHMLNNTIQDVLVRRARMQGKNACWVPGTDHASIATEAKVVQKLKSEGIEKSSLSREKFLEHAWEWKEKHGDIILEQLKKLGASCDWDRTKFTMDDDMYESVIKVFVDLYNKGLVYRGVRMVNWDPKALTALSDEEVVYKEEASRLYYVNYPVEGEQNRHITIATTRPETILGDTAVCINPNDERFEHLKGKRVIIPVVNRSVPVIEDEYVDMEFGTGALKITPAHDVNDYEIGIKHKLDTIDIFEDNGTMSEEATYFVGEDRFDVRQKMIQKLEQEGYLLKVEDYTNKVGYSERTNVVIEPKLSLQWFLDMKELARPALDSVMNDTIRFYPAKFKNTYRHWMENVHNWCISRQLWWGQRIPAYYTPDKDYVVAETKEKALEIAQSKYNSELKLDDLTQDEDVLDTWFSSWLWPISVFDGIRHPDNKEIDYYYPTDDLVTAPEILFFWVARMIMAGYEYRGEQPFKNVYLTGIVRDKHGQKMSKSLGNSPDPLRLIQQYGADGVRIGMLLTSPAGNDLPFDEVLCEQGRNFSNKIWNAMRLVKGWQVDDSMETPVNNTVSVDWMHNRLMQELQVINDHFEKFRISNALMSVYRLIWDDFCSWYLEMVKPSYQKPIDRQTLENTIDLFEKLMKVLHPFMPFLTEEVWHNLRQREEGESIMIINMPEVRDYDSNLLERFAFARETVMAIRNLRNNKNIPPKQTLNLYISGQQDKTTGVFAPVVMKLANLEQLEFVREPVENALQVLVRSTEMFIPFEGTVNKEEELEKLQKELEYQEGFLNGVMKKLGNERFVNNAPEAVVQKEQQKKEDAEEKIRLIKTQMNKLK
ncbi:MAG: valine--tRNA ligase [Bacteroidales bacterium]|nr:valine--tRNA ligase [Bacteroidales bacterium]MCF8326989.1 valine--tRNA ligase [Bacteroidales bacterium]